MANTKHLIALMILLGGINTLVVGQTPELAYPKILGYQVINQEVAN